jgi:hypothetical protein
MTWLRYIRDEMNTQVGSSVSSGMQLGVGRGVAFGFTGILAPPSLRSAGARARCAQQT